jgi:DNA-binding MarR family transcriptional regulator
VDDTRWLTPREQQAWRSYLTVVRLVQETVEGQLGREADMPHAYYEILVMLSEAPDRRLRMRDLAEVSLSSKSRLSHAVARLQERGWVRRVPSPCDRRSQIAELTDEGFTALAAAAPGHVAQVREAFIDALTPDQLDQLDEIARAVVTHLGREPRTVAAVPALPDETDRAS